MYNLLFVDNKLSYDLIIVMQFVNFELIYSCGFGLVLGSSIMFIGKIMDVTERQFKMTLKTSLCANQSHTSEPLFPFSLDERDSRVLLSDAAIKKCC